MAGEIITGTLKAWKRPHSRGNSTTPEGKLNDLCYTEAIADLTEHGYTHAGEAQITVTLLPKEEMIRAEVNTLREQIKAVRAEAGMKVTDLEARIQNLLAIEHSPQPDPDDDVHF